MPPLAISKSLDQIVRRILQLSQGRRELNLSTIDIDTMPADWRVWSPFHGLVLEASEFAALNPVQKAALRSWVAQGGRIFLEPSRIGVVGEEKIGSGSILTFSHPLEYFTEPPSPPDPNDDPPERLDPWFFVQWTALNNPAMSLPTMSKLRLTQLPSELLSEKEKSVGRALEFLVQEMGREIQTLLAKAIEGEIVKIALGMRGEIEKIREQVQNLE